STLSPASSDLVMYSVLFSVLPDNTTALPGLCWIMRSKKSLPAYTFSCQCVGDSARVLKLSIRSTCNCTSGPSGAYTCTTESTPSYMDFCTNAAWKCPGSNVINSTISRPPVSSEGFRSQEITITSDKRKQKYFKGI